jgi:hypothetical protein
MWELLSDNWLWVLVLGGMVLMHLGHARGHNAHGGHGGCGAHQHSGQQSPDQPRLKGQGEDSSSPPTRSHDHGRPHQAVSPPSHGV